ncbi:uncharacterized protein LOC110686833 [Chenopodium quinoa]|uniref:uncharacterized protein LOC110686833 n=1 Tax=Chenopodium quinoa TaxID=63459 RepID=UPI000B782874|nr:uncharacterized protein LOC110686833 [Chenopodium quinoa]
MKSHCHVFMERLLPVAMRELLPDNVWKAVTEISQFFRDLCSYTIKVDDVTRLEKNIPEILCKLEKIFPPAFFNSMEHLPVHLPHEVKVGGPVQYRWMYPFERFLNHLKKKIGSKARVEGSICKAYLAEEISNFCSYYFQPHVDTKSRDLGRNVVDDDDLDSTIPKLFQFSKGRGKGVQTRFLGSKEFKHAHHYVLSNCGVLGEYERKFEESMMQKYPGIDLHDIWSKFSHEFSKWFQDFVIKSNETDEVIRALAMGPSRQVKTWRQFDINGFKFHTFDYGKHKATMNYGVGVISEEEIDYFGILEEVIELVYLGTVNVFKTFMFKCNWMDSVNGMNIHEQY